MPYEKDDIVRMDITVEMNLNKKMVARDGYTSLDFLSDIGGMQGMLISFAAIWLAFWNHNQLENFLVSKLYILDVTPNADQSGDLPSDNDIYSSSDFSEKPEDAFDFTKLQKLKPPFLFNPREFLRENLQNLFCYTSFKCCRVARMERAYDLARKQLEEEFDIVQILRDQRLVEEALKLLLTED